MVAIQLQGASLRYQNKLLFSDLDLTLPAEQWTVLLGPSGVGKTSLLRLMAGLMTSAYSQNPITTSDDLPLSGRISYLSQHDALLPWLSVIDNVLIGEKLRGQQNQKREQAQALLIRLGLGNVLNQRPAQLSGGMRQRVALARTLLEARPIVLMDEPFSALDAVTRLQLQELAAELLQQRTILLITHDPLEALRLGHTIYVMQGLPAHLSSPIKPAGNIPRAVNDPQLFQLQAQLIMQLTKAKGLMSC